MNETIDPPFVDSPSTPPDAFSNPLLQALLSAMNPNLGSSGTLPPMPDLLRQLENTDPTLGLIAKYLLSQQESVKHADAATVGFEDEPYQTRGASKNVPQIVEHLKNRIKNLQAELEYLRERNDTLALALGACYLCWGEDSDCPACGGNGRPGSTLPAKQVFSQLIVPAIHAIKAPKEVHGNSSNKRQVWNT